MAFAFRNRAVICLAAAVALLAAQEARSAIIGSCTIMIGPSGTMMANPTLNVLGSRQAGGNAATVTINPQSLLCNILALIDCYSISAPAPVSFLTAPSGAADNMTFASIFKINGGADIPGNTPVMVANGTKTVQVDLTATKSSGIFPAGTYQAQVTVRCE
jgi:hypothetical protein